MEKIGLSVEEAAAAIGIGRSEMYELLAGHKIDSFKIGRRRIVPMDAVRRFVADSTSIAGSGAPDGGAA